MNQKTLIPQFTLVALTLSAPAALSQEEILIITGKRGDKTVFYQISPTTRELDFSDNRLTSLDLPAGLTNLEELNLATNQLSSFMLPAGLTSLEDLDLNNNRLTSLILPEDLTSLRWLDLSDNQLTSLNLPENLPILWGLDLSNNPLSSLTLPENLSSLRWLDLSDSQLTSLTLPAGLTSLSADLSGNQLTSFTLPEGLTDLWLDLSGNRLTSLVLPKGLTDLWKLDLSGNQLMSITLPARLASLRLLDLRNNPIERLLVPEGMDIDNLELHGFSKEDIERYTPRAEDGWVVIVFRGGVLQATDNISSGDWKDVPNAVSPFRVNPAVAARKFFRVQRSAPIYQELRRGCFGCRYFCWDSIPGSTYCVEVRVWGNDHYDSVEEIVANSEETCFFPSLDSGPADLFRVVLINPSNSSLELSIEKAYQSGD